MNDHWYKMERVFIIAEAGVNHNGDIQLAKALIDAAAQAGADAVKFQTFVAENLISKHAIKAEYQIQNTGNAESQLEMVKKLELAFEDFVELKAHSDKNNIQFLSTPFDNQSIDFLAGMHLPIMKIPSGEITNLPYLQKIGKLGKQVFLSTGMSNLGEIEKALEVLTTSGTDRNKIVLLHCNTEYPTPITDVNLRAMTTLKEAFCIRVGYSDHTLGIEVPVAAVALGAAVIEKHFTLDKNMQGPDHAASLEPHELQHMVQAIRNIEAALGDGIKKASASEAKNKAIARKSLHMASALKKGHIVQLEDLTVKRPGNGIPSVFIEMVVGRTLNCDVEYDDMLQWEYLK
jgi:N,N'-diacetyllegionaminate synthase